MTDLTQAMEPITELVNQFLDMARNSEIEPPVQGLGKRA